MKLNNDQIRFLKNKFYLREDETIDERIQSILNQVEPYAVKYKEPGLTKRLHTWLHEKYISLSTPQLANVGRPVKETDKSIPLPCSCNIIPVPNSIDGIYKSMYETAMLSKLGAGVGANMINVVDGGTKIDEGFHTNSKLDWAEDIIRTSKKVSQNAVRRGYAVVFDSIYTKEFDTYIERLDKTNPDKKDPFVKNNFGFILPIGFWENLKTDEELQRRFLEILELRRSTGKIYLLDVENCNKNQSPVYKTLNKTVDSTNICTEALSCSEDDLIFACMLLSFNLKHWDVIKENPQIIKDGFILSDIFVEMYIDQTENVVAIKRARDSAIQKRDIGLGTLGLHDYFQAKGWAFGDMYSRKANKEIYKLIREVGEQTTKELAEKLGSPKMCQDAGLTRRNVSLMMVAPNKSTAYFMDTSEGCQPRISNYYVDELAGVETTFKNKHLTELLEKRGKNSPEVWESILVNLGSVQHLDFLSDQEKRVFKTASEISPKDIIDLAADRQVYIDMSQSLNLFQRPNYTLQDTYDIHKYAFSKGIKTLYYYYPQAHAALEKEGESWDSCEACAD